MKNYNVNNYSAYKNDIKINVKRIGNKEWRDHTRDELILVFLPLVENLARKFSTAQQASGVMTVTDMIQEGNVCLIKGIDINRGSMRIPEHKLNEIRKNFGENKKEVEMFFNSIFCSIDSQEHNGLVYDIPEEDAEYNNAILNAYLLALLKQHLNQREEDVIRMSFGLDCEKHSATEIANHLGIKGSSSYVRVSQLKKQAIDKLKKNVDHSQALDFL